MTDPRIQKIASGNYRVGSNVWVYRSRGKWLVVRTHAADEVYSTFAVARLAALIVAGVATDAESAAFAQEAPQ